jgi:hypothetical protein
MKRTYNKPFFILFLFFLISSSSFAQSNSLNSPEPFKKNSINGNLGYAFYGYSLFGKYERLLTQNTWGKAITTFGTVGYGIVEGMGPSGELITAHLGFFTGRRNNHFELSMGPSYGFTGEFKTKVEFTMNMGWRYQKPGKRFIWRIGLSYPEALYFGTGFAF